MDGETRRPLTPVRALTRTVMAVDHGGQRYEAEVDFLALGKDVSLYRDGRLVERRDSPAIFNLPDGARIEIATSLYGVTRARLVAAATTAMAPIPGSWEYRRLRWNAAHPAAARLIGAGSWLVLVASAILGLPQLLELITGIEAVAATVGWSFTSPIQLPSQVNTLLGILVVIAALERATRLKSSWLDDLA